MNNPIDIIPSEDIAEWVEEISSFGKRRPGTLADSKAEDFITEKLEDFGLPSVEKQPYQISKWEAEEWNLIVNGAKVPCFYTPNTAFTSEDSLETEMVYLGEGKGEDFEKKDVKGKIVLFENHFPMLQKELLEELAYFVHDPDETLSDFNHPATWLYNDWWRTYRLACENEATGLVGVLSDYPTNENRLYIPYYGPLREKLPEIVSTIFGVSREMPEWIPGMWVGSEDGANLVNEVKENGGSAKAHLTLTGSVEPAKTHNIVGLLPGKKDDTIILHSHHDSPWNGAVEDASGVSELLAMAQYFASKSKNDREKTLCFLFTGTHFGGPARGGQTFIENNPETMSNLMLEICIEHIAKDFDAKENKWIDTGLPEPRAIFAQGGSENATKLLSNTLAKNLEKHNLTRSMILPGNTPLGVPTDANAFARNGHPLYSYISGPEYLFDPCDTMDKVAINQLNPVATTFAETIEKLDNTTPEKIKT